MKIVITADIHFGHSDHLGKINPETGLHTRLEDFLHNFDLILEYVMNPSNDIGLFIIAGDLYKTRHPTNTQQEEFAKRLRVLQDHKISTIILMGNHDIVVSEGASHTAGVLGALTNEQYIQVIDSPTQIIKDGTQLVCMPYIYRQKLGVKTNVEALEYYKQQVRELRKEGLPCMFVGHQSVEGARMPSGYIDPEKVSEIIVPQSLLEEFDFAVFGHIHEHQVVSRNPNIVYTGPLDRIDFSQADKPVGFVVYDTKAKRHGFVELPAVDLYHVKVDVTDGQGDLTSRIMESIDKDRLPGGIVKLEYSVRETDLSRINKSAIQELLGQARFNAGIVPHIQREQVSRNQEINETISAEDALKKYIESREDLRDIADEMFKRGVEIIRQCNLDKE